MLHVNVDDAKPNKFTFTNHKTGETMDMLGPDGQVAAEKIEAVMKTLTPKQQRRLIRKVQAEQAKLASDQQRRLAEKESQLRALDAMEATLAAWRRGEVRLERPVGSVAYKLLEAFSDDLIIAENDDTIAAIKAAGGVAAIPFVIEHDWAAAFAGAQDFTEGEYKLPFDDVLFEFRANGCPVCIVTGARGHFMFFCVVGRWMAALWNPLDDLFVAQVRAVCIALDADVAASDTVRAPEKLNRSRAAKGKRPLLDYHVVRLSRRERAAPLPDDLGGGDEHRRKRMHFVRGHWRHYETHKTWIKWYLRGDPDLGFIDKHYRL